MGATDILEIDGPTGNAPKREIDCGGWGGQQLSTDRNNEHSVSLSVGQYEGFILNE